MSELEAQAKTPLEHATDAVGLILTLVALYRFSYPEGPEPSELARDAWGRFRGWLDGHRRTRSELRAYEAATLEAIRNLPETEAPPE